MRKKNLRVYVNCEDFVEIEVSENSKVEVFKGGSCRGEYFGGGEVWNGMSKIRVEVWFLNDEMKMGESGVWWIKVDGKVVYGNGEDYKNWKKEMEWYLEEVSEECDEIDVEECERLLEGLNEENWFDVEYVGKISDMLCVC